MKLWVDDIRPAPEGWVLARTSEQAIKLLAKMSFDEISLDHDDEASSTRQDTFQPVAYFIGVLTSYNSLPEGDYAPQPKITIHSINPVGAKEIQNILRDYGLDSTIEPYMADIKRLEEDMGMSLRHEGEVYNDEKK